MAPCAASGLNAKYPEVALNSLGAEIKNPTRPDVSTLVGDAQGGGNRRIRLIIHTARPSLADAMRIIDGWGNPVGAKFDGGWLIVGSSPRTANAAWSPLWGPMVGFMRIQSIHSAWAQQGDIGAVFLARRIDGG